MEYIVDSEEGRKYWHFFKHMLLGSEEHYYVSLLYNWPRTTRFIQTLSAQSVWNTWTLGTLIPDFFNVCFFFVFISDVFHFSCFNIHFLIFRF